MLGTTFIHTILLKFLLLPIDNLYNNNLDNNYSCNFFLYNKWHCDQTFSCWGKVTPKVANKCTTIIIVIPEFCKSWKLYLSLFWKKLIGLRTIYMGKAVFESLDCFWKQFIKLRAIWKTPYLVESEIGVIWQQD